MIDSTISRARMRDLTGLGRVILGEAGGAGSPENHASPRRHLTDATSIGEAAAAAPQTARLAPRARRSRGINHLEDKPFMLARLYSSGRA
jgi:hypothetical protein